MQDGTAAGAAGLTARSAVADASPAGPFRSRRSFLILSVLVGVPLALLVAPFQAPDEAGHFLRAYQVSEGGIVPVHRGKERGGELPTSLTEVIGHFSGMKPPRHARTSRRQIEAALRVPLAPRERAFKPFVSSIYSPVAYLPQAAAIGAGRVVGLHPLALMYLGRLANLMVWIALGYAALRAAPDLGRPLLLLLMMPMSIFQAASLSADATTNGLAVLLAALVWRHVTAGTRAAAVAPAVGDEPSAALPRPPPTVVLGWPALLGLGALTAAISLTKFAYLPLAALVLLIPASRLGGRGHYWLVLAALLAVNVVAFAAWAPQTGGLDTVVRPDSRVSPRGQVDYLIAHPAAMITIPAMTFAEDGMFVLKSFVGRLGSVDIPLPVWFIVGYLAALIAACRPGVRDPPPPRRSRLAAVVLVVTALSVAAIGLLNYIYWTPVGSRTVDGLQGRYLIPLAPAVLLLIRGLLWPLRRRQWDWATARRLDIAAAAIAAIAGVYTLAVVYVRYYGPGWPHWHGG